MPDKVLRMIFLTIGFCLAVLALLWAVSLSFQGQLVENSVKVGLVAIVAIIFLIIGQRE